jgi:integrase
MPVQKLTDAYLRGINPKPGRGTICISDQLTPGLQVRIGARGRKDISYVFRVVGDPKQYRRHFGWVWDPDDGPTPDDRWVTLDRARTMAAEIRERAGKGIDWDTFVARKPQPNKPDLPADAVEAVLTRYGREHLARAKTGTAIDKLLRQSCHAFLDWLIGDVTRKDIRAVLDGHMKRGKGYLANRVHATLSAFFSWALDRDLIETSPMANMRRPMEDEEARDRVLSDVELAAVWNAVGTLTPARRDCIRFLMLTGLRRAEATELKWSDIDGDTLTIRREQSKNNVARLIPLSPQALDLINNQPRTGDFVFDHGTNKRLDLSTYVAKLAKTLGLPDWRLHDFRRTMATGMQDMGVRQEVADKCLHDKGTTIKGVTAVYLRSQYLPERKAAMIAWGEHVAKVIAT